MDRRDVDDAVDLVIYAAILVLLVVLGWLGVSSWRFAWQLSRTMR